MLDGTEPVENIRSALKSIRAHRAILHAQWTQLGQVEESLDQLLLGASKAAHDRKAAPAEAKVGFANLPSDSQAPKPPKGILKSSSATPPAEPPVPPTPPLRGAPPKAAASTAPAAVVAPPEPAAPTAPPAPAAAIAPPNKEDNVSQSSLPVVRPSQHVAYDDDWNEIGPDGVILAENGQPGPAGNTADGSQGGKTSATTSERASSLNA
jgi:hypothetical protein